MPLAVVETIPGHPHALERPPRPTIADDDLLFTFGRATEQNEIAHDEADGRLSVRSPFREVGVRRGHDEVERRFVDRRRDERSMLPVVDRRGKVDRPLEAGRALDDSLDLLAPRQQVVVGRFLDLIDQVEPVGTKPESIEIAVLDEQRPIPSAIDSHRLQSVGGSLDRRNDVGTALPAHALRMRFDRYQGQLASQHKTLRATLLTGELRPRDLPHRPPGESRVKAADRLVEGRADLLTIARSRVRTMEPSVLLELRLERGLESTFGPMPTLEIGEDAGEFL